MFHQPHPKNKQAFNPIKLFTQLASFGDLTSGALLKKKSITYQW